MEFAGRTLVIAAMILVAMAVESRAATIKGRIVSDRINNFENFVVFIKQADPKFFTAPQDPVINLQEGIRIIPMIQPVVRGTKVIFVNNDSAVHNLHTFTKNPISFDFSIGPGSRYGPIKFDKEGEVMLLCNMHAQMKGYILVLQNPYFAKVDKKGFFTITNVPPGEYELMTWHDEYISFTRKVVIKNLGETASAQFKY